jgi:hypothetical protein
MDGSVTAKRRGLLPPLHPARRRVARSASRRTNLLDFLAQRINIRTAYIDQSPDEKRGSP